MKIETVAIYGGGSWTKNNPAYQDAFLVGKILAQCGCTVINGGYGGAMYASALGVSLAHGRVIGHVLKDAPSLFPNEYCTKLVHYSDRIKRLIGLITIPDACVVVLGGKGTFAEFFIVWDMVDTRTIPKKPIVVLGKAWKKLRSFLAREGFSLKEKDWSEITIIENPEEIVSALGLTLLGG